MKQPLKNWVIAARPWSFPASTMPVLLTVSFLFYSRENIATDINWWYAVAVVLGVIAVHAAGNLISDYYDFKHNVDRKESFGSSRMLVEGVFEPKTILHYGQVLLLIAAVIGVVLTVLTGLDLLWIILLGGLGTYFYYKLKAIALGDLLIFIIYGPLIGLGTAYVLTQTMMWEILLLNVPVAMLVVNILHANNTRDIKHDAMANIRTQAMVLGIKGSKIQYVVLGLGAYLVLILFNAFGFVSALSLITLISAPLVMKNVRLMMKVDGTNPEIIKDLDGMSAQVVMAFSVLFSIANFIAGVL